MRTCIGCRRSGPRSVLTRYVVVEVEGRLTVVPDPRRRLPGRGAWVHDDPGCQELAVRRRAFGRALRVTGELDLRQVHEHHTAPPRTQ